MVTSDYPASSGLKRNENATIRTLFLAAVANELPGRKEEIDALLEEHGFFRSQMTSPYERVPLHRYISLLESAAVKFARPFLGLEMGEKFGLTELGPFHALFTSSSSLRDALATFARFQSRWQTRTLLGIDRAEQVTTYSYRIDDPDIWPRRQDAEFTIAGLITLIKQLTNAKWVPVEVHLEHALAGREQHLQRFFRAPTFGSQASNQLVILNQDLDRPLPRFHSDDGRLKTILESHLLDLVRLDAATPKSMAERTAETIARRLGQASVECDVIASDLNLSVRSLRRRLMEEGTSFREVLQETRQAKARTMLENGEIPLVAAARILGYSDTATFSRAFKQWTGTPPRRFSRKEP